MISNPLTVTYKMENRLCAAAALLGGVINYWLTIDAGVFARIIQTLAVAFLSGALGILGKKSMEWVIGCLYAFLKRKNILK